MKIYTKTKIHLMWIPQHILRLFLWIEIDLRKIWDRDIGSIIRVELEILGTYFELMVYKTLIE